MIDLRSLKPPDREAIRATVEKTGRAVVLCEGYRTAGFGAELVAQISELAIGRAIRTSIPIPDNRIVIRPMLDLTLTCDHRVIGGATGAAFLLEVADALEHPGLPMA